MSMFTDRLFLYGFNLGFLIIVIDLSRMRIVIQDQGTIRVIRINTMGRLSPIRPGLPSTIKRIILSCIQGSITSTMTVRISQLRGIGLHSKRSYIRRQLTRPDAANGSRYQTTLNRRTSY